jgi:putative flippase GtrA
MTRMRAAGELPGSKSRHRVLLAFDRAPRIVRFVMSGGIVALLSVSVMTGLVLAGMPSQAALPVAYALGLSVHFSLNRSFVFSSHAGYALALSAQGRRYLTIALTSYGLTALSLAVIPSAVDAPQLAVYYVTAAVLAITNFLLLRRWVFAADVNTGDGGCG